jgi:hypothetical protein
MRTLDQNMNDFERIAKSILSDAFETLKTRNRDSLDFHEVSVGGVRRAFQAVYELGYMHARPRARTGPSAKTLALGSHGGGKRRSAAPKDSSRLGALTASINRLTK